MYAASEASGSSEQAQVEEQERRIEQLGQYIDDHMAEWDLGELKTALDLQSTLVARLARVRQIQGRVGGDSEELRTAISDVLDELAAEWGVDL